jgi:hypothetical protein
VPMLYPLSNGRGISSVETRCNAVSGLHLLQLLVDFHVIFIVLDKLYD